MHIPNRCVGQFFSLSQRLEFWMSSLLRLVGRRNVFRVQCVEATLNLALLLHQTTQHYIELHCSHGHHGQSGCCYDEGLYLQCLHTVLYHGWTGPALQPHVLPWWSTAGKHGGNKL